jgi:hypothetical protein
MSEMSKAQGPVGGHVDANPTDDMVPPAPQPQPDPDSPQDRSDFDGSEDVGPEDYGAEDVIPQDYGPTGGEEGSPPAQSSSDPMPDMAGEN